MPKKKEIVWRYAESILDGRPYAWLYRERGPESTKTGPPFLNSFAGTLDGKDVWLIVVVPNPVYRTKPKKRKE